MGKGKRIRAGRAAEKEAMKIANAKKAKKQKNTKIISIIVAVVAIVCLATGLIYHAVYSASYKNGNVQRNTVVLETDNYTVDAAMMSYFFYSQYNNFANNYSSYLSSLGLDTSLSLKDQDCSLQSGTSWYDYFAEQAGSEVKEYLYLAEKAKEEGVKLDENDQKNIQEILDAYYESSKEYKMSGEEFLSTIFGTGVKEKDVVKCLELSLLAQKFYDQYEDSLTYSDKEIDAYYKKNKDSYRYVDYYSYSVVAEDIENKETYADAKAKAKQLAAVTSTDDFTAWVEKDYRDNATITDEYTKEDLETDVETELDGLEKTNVLFVEDDAASEWLFDNAKVGETYVDDDEKGTYTVYYCTATPYRDESATRTIRDIVLTTSTYDKDEIADVAADIVEEMKKDGLKEDTFIEYAAKYSENTATSGNGGLCENYKESSFDGNIGKWTFNKDRKTGDFEAIKIDEGYAICYYIGEGIEAWKSDCIADMKTGDYEEDYEEWTETIKLTENEKGYNKIPNNV